MFTWSSDFTKKSFLNEGAIYGSDDQIYLLWGAEKPVKNRPSEPAIWAPDFFLKTSLNWLPFRHGLKLTRKAAKELFSKQSSVWNWEEASKSEFRTQFDWVKAWILEGSIAKAVPYVFETTKQDMGFDKIESLLASALEFEQGFLYGYWNTSQGLLGVTPEVLVTQKNNQTYETMALAGTCEKNSYVKDPGSFINNTKEIKEHELVVEEIKKFLTCMNDVICGERSVRLTPHLAHLYTPIQMKGDKINFSELVCKLHPTPALGCSPRGTWKNLMGRLAERLPRDRFGAPFVLSFDENRAQALVAIRNIQWADDHVQLGSGCGVVQESDFEKEWQELSYKRNSVKNMLGVV